MADEKPTAGEKSTAGERAKNAAQITYNAATWRGGTLLVALALLFFWMALSGRFERLGRAWKALMGQTGDGKARSIVAPSDATRTTVNRLDVLDLPTLPELMGRAPHYGNPN